MKKVIRSVLCVAVLSIGMPSLAFAANCTTTKCTSYVNNFWLTSASSKVVRVSLATGHTHLLMCTPYDGQYLTLHGSHPLFDEILEELRLAKLTGELMTIRIDTNSSDCTIQYTISE